MKNEILSYLPQDFPWKDRLQWFDTIDSTNTRARLLASQGAPEGTVLAAGMQTGGRGRMGRSFSSPSGMGVYLSCILRPECKPESLMHLTCAVGTAMCQAAEQVSGLRPRIKWTNDLVAGRKKLGGILTELSVAAQSGTVEYAVVGIGINCLQKKEDFPPELQDMALSLSEAAGRTVPPARLAAAMMDALYRMNCGLLTEKAAIMDAYRRDCMTLGQQIRVVRGDSQRTGIALDLDSDGGLLVQYDDGSTSTVTSGEVSVRGMYGYL